jgi:hypothetical protein
MMLTANLALVSEVDGHDPTDVAAVAAALQKQVTRDFAPIWDVQATVDAFPRLEDVPIGYWPMIVRDDIEHEGAAGIHLDKDGQPFALITMGHSWSLTASHETLEMLADPNGNRLVAGDSPKEDQGRVRFLVEVCDPSESEKFAYTVNGILVSDFYTPRYFDPTPSTTIRYSYTDAIKEPRTILPGGYISWQDLGSGNWWQQIWRTRDPEPRFRELGPFEADVKSLRSEIDKRTPHPVLTDGLDPSNETLQAAVASGDEGQEASAARASALREQVQAVLDEASD